MKKLLTIPLFLFFVAAYSQDVATSKIAWSCSKSFEVSTGKLEMGASKVTTYKGDSIVWLDAKGVKKTLAVKKVTGSWANVNMPGEVLYQVERGQQRGTVLIKKSTGGTVIRVVLTEATSTAAQTIPSMTELTVLGILDLGLGH